MKLYITIEQKKVIKKNYQYLFDGDTAILDIPSILKEINYDSSIGGISGSFVLGKEIEKRLLSVYKNKRYNNLIYILSSKLKPDGIDTGFITNFKTYTQSIGVFFIEYNLIDYSQKLDESVYKYFDKIL